MRQSRAFIPTMRETPADVENKSHKLLLRAGFLRQHTSGVYSYLPFGLKVLKKIETIVREEMEGINAVEMRVASLQKEALTETFQFADSSNVGLLQVEDRKHRQYVVGALHKEIVTSLIHEEIHSYKELPLTLYQIVTKFQDEVRPRFGLIQSREFVKKEAYSFHHSAEALQAQYEQVKAAYHTIFTKLHLEQYVVEANPEIGSCTHQFIAPADKGDENIAFSETGSFAALAKQAAVSTVYEKSEETLEDLVKVQLLDENTATEVSSNRTIPIEKELKTRIYDIDGELVAVVYRGDYEISEVKLQKAVGATTAKLAEEHLVEKLLSCRAQAIGPIQLPVGVKVIADHSVSSVINGVSGANENDVYWKNVNPERDFAVNEYVDLRYAKEGDFAPEGAGLIQFAQGFEVGRITSLGTAFSSAGGAAYIDEAGESQPFEIGFYEMNLSRVMALIAEQYHDDDGLKWPKNLAPYDIHLVPIDLNDEEQYELATNLYKLLQSYRFGVLFDDRAERAGVKFQDADLIGLPIRITIGQKAADGILEIKFRETGETAEWQVGEVTEKLQAYFTMYE